MDSSKLPCDQADRWGRTGRQERSERHGNLLTVFDPCGRVQPETDLFEPWRLDGSRLTLMPWQGKAQQDKDGEKERIWGKSKGWGWGVRENIIESQESKWWKRAQRGSWLARIKLRFDKIRHVWLWRLRGRGEQRIIPGHRRACQKAWVIKMFW